MAQTTETIQPTTIPQKVVEQAQKLKLTPQKYIALLVGFRDLEAERTGYFLGRKLKQAEMNDATEKERKATNEIRKTIVGEELEKLITDGNISEYKKILTNLAKARKVVADKSKPFREKINPLRKAQNYIDTVAVPDALKELGVTVQPRFSLSEWIKPALKPKKKSA